MVEKRGFLRTYLTFLHPFPKYLVSDDYALDTVLGTGDAAVNETSLNLCPPRAFIIVDRDDEEINK